MRGFSRMLACGLVASLGGCASAALLRPEAPEMNRRAPERFVVRLETSKGLVVVEVHRDWAPLGADRFFNLVRHGYFDEARFFRVIAGKWAQFGIPGDPEVARLWRGRTLPDDPPRQPNRRGTVAFAFAVPNGRTTQVFINLRDNAETLDAQGFAPFGRVVEGMDVVDRIGYMRTETVPSFGPDVPVERPVLKRAYVIETQGAAAPVPPPPGEAKADPAQ
jgi:peptidyl-prolyl cis-trans isomerase A (cyclophilin A)